MVEQTLRGYVNLYGDDWSRYLSVTEFALIFSVNRTTGSCPFEVIYGFVPCGPVSLLNPSVQTEQIHQRMKDVRELARTNLELVATRDITVPDYKVGDQIKLDTSHLQLRNQTCAKFKHRWVGPLTVLKRVSRTSYLLQLPETFKCHPVFHYSRLRQWKSDTAYHDDTLTVPEAVEDEGTDTPFIKRIRDVKIGPHESKRNGDCFLFLACYRGKDVRYDTWCPYHAVKRLEALSLFLKTRQWALFKSSPAYLDLAARFPSRVPP